MSDRTTSSHPHHTADYGRVVSSVLVVILFAAVLLFGILVALRYAHGWVEVADGAAVAIPMAADGLVAIVSALATAVGVVWLYATRLAR